MLGPFRRLKAWVKRTAVRIFLKIARTRLGRYVRQIVEVSAVPLAITGAGALLGTGIASAAALPLAYGALLGAGVTLAGVIGTKLYFKNAAQTRSRKRLKVNFTIFAKKESNNANRSYVVERSSATRSLLA
jgi:hypothetical protein